MNKWGALQCKHHKKRIYIDTNFMCSFKGRAQGFTAMRAQDETIVTILDQASSEFQANVTNNHSCIIPLILDGC
jgi:hypothetical protein